MSDNHVTIVTAEWSIPNVGNRFVGFENKRIYYELHTRTRNTRKNGEGKMADQYKEAVELSPTAEWRINTPIHCVTFSYWLPR